MKKKRRIKKQVYFVLVFIVIVIIGINATIKHINYINSYEYKLGKIGYSQLEIKTLLKLTDKQKDKILDRKYNANIVPFAKQKYFIFKNLDRYIAYRKDNKSEKLSKIISLVNVSADFDWYDEDAIKDTDVSLKELMLVNKFYHLNEKYVPENIENISATYAYDENSTTKEVFDAFKKMWQKAKSEDINLIITSSYRDYESQAKLWDNYANNKGEEWADSFAARAGYSEHQTGLALDIVTYNSTMDNFDDSPEAKWLKKNAYKYGFILRYPKGKEDITGYDYEPWHYRYVGIDAAKEIQNKGITYDEYYAYYIENKDTK